MISYADESDAMLARLAQSGDARARAAMAERHDPLVKHVAKRFTGRGHEFDDLHQLGRLGLIKAIGNFDADYGTRFSTYAVPLIMGEIRRFLRDDGQLHVSRTIRENAAKLKGAIAELGENAPLAELAARAGIRCEEAALALDAQACVRSFDEPLSPGGELTLKETVGVDDGDRLLDGMLLRDMLKTLQGRERELIVRRYFLEHTQARIAREFDMTQVQVSRMESKILKRLCAAAGG